MVLFGFVAMMAKERLATMTFMWALLSGEGEANEYREEDHKEMTTFLIIKSLFQ